jgi:hypothetical protein
MPDSFYIGTDWQCTSGPLVTRQVSLNDVWPEGDHDSEPDQNDKCILVAGMHPALAVGLKANRPENITGVVVSYNANANLLVMNFADKFCSKQYVANVLTYSAGDPSTFDQSMSVGDPVYVDDSDGLGEGTTLSRSPRNANGDPNPFFGVLWYCQDEYQDYGVGGPNQSAVWPKALDNELDESLYCVLHVDTIGYNYEWVQARAQ